MHLLDDEKNEMVLDTQSLNAYLIHTGEKKAMCSDRYEIQMIYGLFFITDETQIKQVTKS